VPVNYGGIGMVMGHELSHGFDDQGRKFDGKGNLANWWSDAAAAQFATRAQCVANQFDEFTVVNGTHLNGKQALGENIADLAGLKLAFHAMKAKNKSPSAPADATKDEFTPEQAFFINFAQSWCQLTRDDYALNQVKADVHSPPQFRVNGPLSNLTEFQQAFSCGPGSPMVRPPEKRCEIW
jgi:endothelin-converting enzyme/putative endopeptidase